MTGLRDFSLRINQVTGGNARDAISLGGFRLPGVGTSPSVESVRPPTTGQVAAHALQSLINAQSNNLYLFLPVRMLFAIFLQLGHRLLARAAPCRPKIQDHHLAAQIG